MTGIARIPSTILGVISTQASSVMYPFLVIAMVDPGAAPCFTRKASV